MKRVVLDQGLPFPAAAILRAQGWDALHVRERSMEQASDGAILALALQEGRTVITLDRDFPQILALTGATRPSVVLIRQQRLRDAALVDLLSKIWHSHQAEIQTGCILKAGARGTRLRLLPLT